MLFTAGTPCLSDQSDSNAPNRLSLKVNKLSFQIVVNKATTLCILLHFLKHQMPVLDELRRSWLTVRHQCLSPKESTYPYAQSSSTYILYLEGDTKFGAVIRPLVNTEDINRQLLRVRNNKQHFIACLPIALFSRTLPRRRNDDLGSVSYPQHHNPCSNAQGLQISVTC